MDFGIVGVASITVTCYLLALGIKALGLDAKWLPVLCGVMGGGLGLAALYMGVQDFPAADPLTALAVGIVSGLAATGADQIVKQLGDK
jgi:hypothetical protein